MSIRVLIVDDAAFMRMMLRDIPYKKSGYKIPEKQIMVLKQLINLGN